MDECTSIPTLQSYGCSIRGRASAFIHACASAGLDDRIHEQCSVRFYHVFRLTCSNKCCSTILNRRLATLSCCSGIVVQLHAVAAFAQRCHTVVLGTCPLAWNKLVLGSGGVRGTSFNDYFLFCSFQLVRTYTRIDFALVDEHFHFLNKHQRTLFFMTF